jgi:dTDP-4-dehydrorhamnose 3,5-epimerase
VKIAPTRIPDVRTVDPVVTADSSWKPGAPLRSLKPGSPPPSRRIPFRARRAAFLHGLHYQIEQSQGKLVRGIAGEIFDVAVDMRRSSATFGEWVGERLSASNKRRFWIPARLRPRVLRSSGRRNSVQVHGHLGAAARTVHAMERP